MYENDGGFTGRAGTGLSFPGSGNSGAINNELGYYLSSDQRLSGLANFGLSTGFYKDYIY